MRVCTNVVAAAALSMLLWSSLWSSTASAQVFSPGPLAQAHAELEGMGNCKRCHGDGSQHDNGRCLECHTEIARRQQKGEGYHGRLGAQTCAECHQDHRGLAAKLIEWPLGQRGFNHALTTWPLVGAHKKADCRSCHEPRRIDDKDALALQQKGRDTFLGLPTACADCHFDEHRSGRHGGRPGVECARCHTPDAFKPTPRFDHNNKAMASFALTGQHKKVACNKCHTPTVDDDTPESAFPSPQGREYLQLHDIPHSSCIDCHDDPHRGSFGRTCTQCHTTAGWLQILQTAEDTGFHEKTKFPLRGGHTSVACKSCHGPFPGQKAVFKGLKHERCSDCHMDAHVGQLASSPGGIDASRCDRCHTVNGFSPSTFDEAAHDQTRYPLDGAHRAVACAACHTRDASLQKKVTAAVRASLQRQKRALVTADVRLTMPGLKQVETGDGPVVRCESCHKDPHDGQFGRARDAIADEATRTRVAAFDDLVKTQGCAACHQQSGFREERFRHDDSAFPLVGKHKDVACTMCHASEPVRGRRKETVVRYRGVDARCATCHSDEHVGQLARGGVTECARCHQPQGFKPATFNHKDPAQTRFVLEGKHITVACAKCHASVVIPGVDDKEGQATFRYRPVPMDCRSCHEDEHEGRFDRFAPAAPAAMEVSP